MLEMFFYYFRKYGRMENKITRSRSFSFIKAHRTKWIILNIASHQI